MRNSVKEKKKCGNISVNCFNRFHAFLVNNEQVQTLHGVKGYAVRSGNVYLSSASILHFKIWILTYPVHILSIHTPKNICHFHFHLEFFKWRQISTANTFFNLHTLQFPFSICPVAYIFILFFSDQFNCQKVGSLEKKAKGSQSSTLKSALRKFCGGRPAHCPPTATKTNDNLEAAAVIR